MGLYWNPWAITGCLILILGWTLAGIVYATNPHRLQKRALALYLATGTMLAGIGTGIMYAADDVRTSLALQAVGLLGFFCSAPFYLLFLSTLPTRTMSWLRPRVVRTLLWLAPLPIGFLTVVGYDQLVQGVVAVPYARFDAAFTDLGTRLFEVQAVLTATLGIIAALGTVRESPRKGPTRQQAKWYALTFIVWETLQLTAFTILEVAFRQSDPDVTLFYLAAAIIFPGASLLFVLMFGYGILRHHIFDIDLKVKIAINKGTLGGVFVAVFFVVSKLTESLADQVFGGFGWILGAVAAGLMLFALRPLERLATRIADSAMPNTQDTPAYAQFRKLEVYKATVESFLMDGRVTPRERDTLSRLASRLGIAAADAQAVERDVAA